MHLAIDESEIVAARISGEVWALVIFPVSILYISQAIQLIWHYSFPNTGVLHYLARSQLNIYSCTPSALPLLSEPPTIQSPFSPSRPSLFFLHCHFKYLMAPPRKTRIRNNNELPYLSILTAFYRTHPFSYPAPSSRPKGSARGCERVFVVRKSPAAPFLRLETHLRLLDASSFSLFGSSALSFYQDSPFLSAPQPLSRTLSASIWSESVMRQFFK